MQYDKLVTAYLDYRSRDCGDGFPLPISPSGDAANSNPQHSNEGPGNINSSHYGGTPSNGSAVLPEVFVVTELLDIACKSLPLAPVFFAHRIQFESKFQYPKGQQTLTQMRP